MRHRPKRALLAALCCVAGLILTGVIAFHWPLARANDAASLAGFVALSAHPRLDGLANVVAHSVDPTPYGIAGLVLMTIALCRRRWLLAGVVPVTMFGSVATAELLKPIVAHVRHDDWLGPSQQIGSASWPSGHATAAMTLGLCAVIVVPALARPVVALLGCALSIGVSYSILLLRWHFPSDVLGGYLLAGLWISLALAVLWWGQERWPARNVTRTEPFAVRSLFLPLAILGLVIGAAFGLLLGRSHLDAAYTTEHASLLIGATLIALLAAVLAASVAAAMRPSPLATAGGSGPAPRATHRPVRPRAPG
jgi:membrane-associated phospholipid phosphatase